MDQPAVFSHRFNRSSWLAWTLCGLVCAFALIDLGLSARDLLASNNFTEMASDAAWILLPIVFAVVGALITARQPRNRIGWLLLVPASTIVVDTPIRAYLGQFASNPAPTVPILLMAWFQSWSWILLIFPLLLLLLLFPTGRPTSPRWRWVGIYALGMAVFFILIAVLVQEFQDISNGAWALHNPIGFIPLSFFSYIVIPWIVSLLLLTFLCATALFVRYRRASGVERAQIKWLLYASGVFIAIYFPLGLLNDEQRLAYHLLDLLFNLSISLFPIAIAIAILRYKLWDIDVIIRKTLIYSILTGLLALVFFGSVVLIQQVFGRLAGTEDSPIGIVLSTLAIAALFNPLRRFIQDTIDRRFYRKSYDAQKILERFAATTKDEVELEQFAAHLIAVVEETLQPESVSLLLIPGKKR